MREQTQDLIDEEQLERVAQLIDDAERVYFFGTGSSGLIAREMKLRFMRLGVVCEALTDRDGFAWTTSIMDENCLVLGFSYQELPNPSSIVCWMPRKWVPRPSSLPAHQTKTVRPTPETVPVASHSQSSTSSVFPLNSLCSF